MKLLSKINRIKSQCYTSVKPLKIISKVSSLHVVFTTINTNTNNNSNNNKFQFLFKFFNSLERHRHIFALVSSGLLQSCEIAKLKISNKYQF